MTASHKFNSTLPTGSVVVAIDERYSDNNGAESHAIVWDGEKIRSECYASGYIKGSYDDAKVDATPEQILDAAEWSTQNNKDIGAGSTVVLQRSRKAPNRVPLKVLDYDAGYWNTVYDNAPESVQVETKKGPKWVSGNCVKEVVRGKRPWWARTA